MLKPREEAKINEPFLGRLDDKVYVEVNGLQSHSTYLGPYETEEECLENLKKYLLDIE